MLAKKFGEVNWQTIHDAAIAKGGWPELGGDPGWGFFKLVVPNPRRNVGGLAAMIAAAGEYYDRTNISTADVTDPKFQAWLKELMGSLTDVSGASAYTAEDFALFGYSAGDGGQLLESDLLNNMEGIRTRWSDPLVIRYPKYVTWFDFPYTIWVGPETTAAEKNAALQFQQYLLTAGHPEARRPARPAAGDQRRERHRWRHAVHQMAEPGRRGRRPAHHAHGLPQPRRAAGAVALVRSECGEVAGS